MLKYSIVLAVSAVFLTGCPGDDDDDNENDEYSDDTEQEDTEKSPEDPAKALEALCPINCATIEECYGLQDGETMEDCIAQCIEWRTEDLDRMGDNCDDLLIELIECQYKLSCDDYKHYHEEGQDIDDPCGEEFNEYHFTENCMDGAS